MSGIEPETARIMPNNGKSLYGGEKMDCRVSIVGRRETFHSSFSLVLQGGQYDVKKTFRRRVNLSVATPGVAWIRRGKVLITTRHGRRNEELGFKISSHYLEWHRGKKNPKINTDKHWRREATCREGVMFNRDVRWRKDRLKRHTETQVVPAAADR